MNDISSLLTSIELEQIEVNLFRGQNHDAGPKHVFGGQVLTQSVHAAMLTVDEERKLHSMHGYFILPGDLSKPILFEVDRIRDGGSFTTRRVVAVQNGKAIFTSAASFQKEQAGLEHQLKMPDIPAPDELQSDQEILESFKDQLPESIKRYIRPRPVTFKPVDPFSFITPEKQDPFRYVWMKTNGVVPNHSSVRQRILAYASDYNLLTTALLPHQDKVMLPQMQIASLDHAMWFHHDFNTDEWLLYALDSPSASNSRGFTRGNIFTQSGKLIASVVQEGLLRKLRN